MIDSIIRGHSPAVLRRLCNGRNDQDSLGYNLKPFMIMHPLFLFVLLLALNQDTPNTPFPTRQLKAHIKKFQHQEKGGLSSLFLSL